jgi:O-methyltransferase
MFLGGNLKMEISPFKRWLHWVFQNLLLLIPRLSEMRLATNKVMEFMRVWHYLSRAKITGDYLEFGVFEGQGFSLSMKCAKRFFTPGRADSPRFFAFDSFQGNPDIHPTRDANVFEKGTCNASLDFFKKRIKGSSKGWDVKIITGFYHQSLKPGLRDEHGMKTAAFVNIDCGLYESTMEALRFTAPLLKTGTVLYFDDWYYSGGDMRLSEPGACADWLKENSSIQLIDFGNVGIMGKLFIVYRVEK